MEQLKSNLAATHPQLHHLLYHTNVGKSSFVPKVATVTTTGALRPTPRDPGSRLHPAGRLWEVDALRGVAIVMMVVYHLLFDLSALAGYDIDVVTGFWRLWARVTASLFITLVGVSLTLSLTRARQAAPAAPLFGKFLRRGLEVFGCGLLVTAATAILYPSEVVTFGILHFIGTGIVLAFPFLGLKWLNLPLGLACLVLGRLIEGATLPFPWLWWLGLPPAGYSTFDYFPLFPSFGLILLGVWAGELLYPAHVRHFPLPDLSATPPARLLGTLGRHSLLIYLIHQPLLMGALMLLGIVRLF